MKYISNLREGERVGDIYLCKTKQAALTKAGKPYESLILQDKTGTLDAKIWDPNSQGIEEFEALDYIAVVGDVTSFQGALQLNIKRVRKVSEKDIEKMYLELAKMVQEMENPYLKKLCSSFFLEDKAFEKDFKFHSAAKNVHHGYVGGLLEHTLSVAKLCMYYTQAYPMLNKDLLLAAAMFHDIGKLQELSVFPENDYTDAGQLLGHIMIGAELVGERIRTIPGFPVKLANELKHCILSHHGELEYGSPKKPAIAEAMALSFADNTDAKMQTMKEALAAAEGNSGWLGYNRLFESNIRRTSE